MINLLTMEIVWMLSGKSITPWKYIYLLARLADLGPL
jgi:hypothetical protein